MKDLDKVYAEKIAEEYAPKTESKVVALKKLDAKVKRPVNIFGYTFGSVMMLVLGTGMCLVMGKLGDGSMPMTLIGVGLGVFGIAGGVINYFISKAILSSRKKKYASDIVELAGSIIK